MCSLIDQQLSFRHGSQVALGFWPELDSRAGFASLAGAAFAWGHGCPQALITMRVIMADAVRFGDFLIDSLPAGAGKERANNAAAEILGRVVINVAVGLVWLIDATGTLFVSLVASENLSACIEDHRDLLDSLSAISAFIGKTDRDLLGYVITDTPVDNQ